MMNNEQNSFLGKYFTNRNCLLKIIGETDENIDEIRTLPLFQFQKHKLNAYATEFILKVIRFF